MKAFSPEQLKKVSYSGVEMNWGMLKGLRSPFGRLTLNGGILGGTYTKDDLNEKPLSSPI